MWRRAKISIFIYHLLTIMGCSSAEVLQLEHIHSLRKRAIIQSVSESFHVSEMTFACNQSQSDATKQEIQQLLNSTVSIRRVTTLTETDMQNLLQFKGGTFIPEYLATDTITAEMNFPDARIMRFRRNYDRVAAEIKSRNARFSQLKQGVPLDQIVNSRGNADKPSGLSGMSASAQWQTYSRKLLQSLGQKQEPTQPQGAFQRGKSKRRRRRQLNMSLFPTTTQQPNRLQENCSEAGDPSQYDPNFLHLCKICSSQRVLEDNFYPHLLNEVYCKPSENGCLGNGNGKCAPTIFNIHILKRREDMCRVCIKDQEPLVVNEWEIYNESINVGCECMLNKNSDYRSRWFSQPQSTAYSLNNVGKR